MSLPERSGVLRLTVSERRVAELAAEGRSNPEIAQALLVTRKTVETHLGRAYHFFGALVLTGLAAALHLSGDRRNVLPWIAAAFILYLIAVVITLAVNVPLNDTIKAAGDPDRIGDLAEVRRHFGEAWWSAWNFIRTVASTAAFGCLIGAAMM